VDSSAIEQLLASFATAALRIDLGKRIIDALRLPTSHQRVINDEDRPSGWCAWHTA
jgi:hypothetical protein